MILRCILISNFISNQPINWLYTTIESVDFFQPIELVSNWLIFAIFILSVQIPTQNEKRLKLTGFKDFEYFLD
jgi:hypothetical protein